MNATATPMKLAIAAEKVNVYYAAHHALKDVNLHVPERKVTALIGPSGCGKSTFLRSINRMNDRIGGFRLEGTIDIHGTNPYARNVDLLELRRRVGMVFQKPNPFPKSIYENIALGPRSHYGLRGKELDDVVEEALKSAALWNEVKDDFRTKSALSLSGGQQQRLCIARMLAVNPEIILMDEPCSALDPISTAKIEDLILDLKKDRTVVIVTHNLPQAERVSDCTAFFMFGEVVESAETHAFFTAPARQESKDYVSGQFG